MRAILTLTWFCTPSDARRWNSERVLEGVDRRAAQVVKFDSSSSSDRDTVDLASLAKVKVCFLWGMVVNLVSDIAM